MSKNRKTIMWTSMVGLSLIGTAVLATDHAEALGFGKGIYKVYTTTSSDGTIIKIRFNPNFHSPQSEYYGGTKEFYREVYFPENGLPGGFVWFSPVPPKSELTSLQQTDMSAMLENRQTADGANGDWLVKEASGTAYRYNLKYGSAEPGVGQYRGYNSGTKKILYGDFKGKNYEWRFLGYNSHGNAIGNPYFPDDSQSKASKAIQNKYQYDVYWSDANWIPQSWNYNYSINLFGETDALNTTSNKINWINNIFFKQFPEFRARGNAQYWASVLRPLTDPSKETGVWLGWTKNGGDYWYTTFVTPPPSQNNLRLTNYKIYDSQNKLVASETRNAIDYNNNQSTVDIKQEFIEKGETYHIVVDVKNMTDHRQDISNFPIQLEHMYSFDDKIGAVGSYSTPVMKATADAPHQNQLKSGETAHFSYTYTVPTNTKPKDFIQFNARIPGSFFDKGYNFNSHDDDASIALEIAPDNLKTDFVGYYDMNKNPVDYVTPNFPMWVKYKVTKTQGTMPVQGSDLTINLNDSKSVTTNRTYQFDGVYDKYGKKLSDGVMRKPGDYAVFWDSITPKYPTLCTKGSIPFKWATKGLNADPTDDVAQPACLINPDNIVVSNFIAKPKTTYLSKGQSSKSMIYTVSFNLTNYNYDKHDKVIPLVYTVDGKTVYKEQVAVQSLNTMKISRILPAVAVGKGQHIVQVEANPVQRKYVEVKSDGSNPYTDNIGWDKVNVQTNVDSFSCRVRHTTNVWNTRFNISSWTGYYATGYSPNYNSQGKIVSYSSFTYPVYNWTYSNPTIGFKETQQITNIFFRSKYTIDNQGGWVDLLHTKGIIKAGYGFELKVVTNYSTNTFNDTPKPFDNGVYSGRYVSPQYSVVDSTARVKVTMPFTDNLGKPVSLVLNGNKVGTWYNSTTTYQLDERTVIDKPERKIYITENTKDGDYNVRVETEPFYGSYDKPYTSSLLCDVQNGTISVQGAYTDDMTSSIVQ